MTSIAFPNIFNSVNTNTLDNHAATASNLRLLLKSIKTELFGDPYFGTDLIKFIYEQNNIVLKDLVIDEIYTSIMIFMPQIDIKREDITINYDGTDLFANIKCVNRLDYQVDLFELNLTSEGE